MAVRPWHHAPGRDNPAAPRGEQGTLNEIESGVPARAEPMSTEEMADKLRRWESLRSEKGGRGGRGDRKRESPAESGSAGKRGARGGRQGEKGKKNKKKKKRRTS